MTIEFIHRSIMRSIGAFVLCTICFCPRLIAQTIRMVDDDGQASAANCDAAGAAFTSPRLAVGAAVSGDTILVCPGTYFGSINFAGKALAMRSVNGPATTILDGLSQDSVVIM